MSTTIDQRIVKLKFDNDGFASGVSQTLGLLDKLKSGMGKFGVAAADKLKTSLNDAFDTAKSSKFADNLNKSLGKIDFGIVGRSLDKVFSGTRFENVPKMINNAFRGIDTSNFSNLSKSFDLTPLSNAISGINSQWSLMGATAANALGGIAIMAAAKAKEIAASFTTDLMKDGFQEYETKIGSIQTILANTEKYGTTTSDVTAALNDLNHYADKTIYNFAEMTKNIGLFTNAGLELEPSVSMIKGFSNAAAASGTNAENAARAAYQLSQGLSAGRITLMDWNSLTNAGMGNANMKQGLVDIAHVLGTLDAETMATAETVSTDFRDSLQNGWLTTDVMSTYLQIMAGDMDTAQMAAIGLSDAQIEMFTQQAKTAEEAATKVRTWTQLVGTAKEAVGSGWAQTFELLLGDFDGATELFSAVWDRLDPMIASFSNSRNDLIKSWIDVGGRDQLVENLGAGLSGILDHLSAVGSAFREFFPPMAGETLKFITGLFSGLFRILGGSEGTLAITHEAFRAIFATLRAIFDVATIPLRILWSIFKGIATTIAKVVGPTDAVGKAFNSLGKAISYLFKPITGLMRLISALATGPLFTTIPEYLGKGIGYVISGFILLLKGVVWVVTQVGKVIMTGVKFVVDALSFIPKNLKSGIDAIPKLISGLSKDILNTLGLLLAGVGFIFVMIGKAAWDGLKSLAKVSPAIYDWIKKLFAQMPKSVEEATKALHDIKDRLESTFESIVDNAPKSFSELKQRLEPHVKEVETILSGMFDKLPLGVQDAVKSATQKFEEYKPVLKSAIDNLAPMFEEGFAKIKPAAELGFKLALPIIKQNIEKIPPMVSEGIKNLPTSFSELMYRVANHLLRFRQNIIKTFHELPGAFSAVLDGLIGVTLALNSGITPALEKLPGVFVKVGKSASDIFEKLPDLLNKAKDFASSSFDKLPGVFQKFGSASSEHLKVVTDMFGKVWDAAQNGLGKLPDLLAKVGPATAAMFGWITSGATELINNGLNKLRDAWDQQFESLKHIGGIYGFLRDTIQNIISAFKMVADYLKNNPVVAAIGEWARNAGTDVGRFLSQMGSTIKEKLGALWETMKDTFSVFEADSLGNMLNNLLTIFAGIFGVAALKNISGFFKKMQGVADGGNDLLEGFLELIKKGDGANKTMLEKLKTLLLGDGDAKGLFGLTGEWVKSLMEPVTEAFAQMQATLKATALMEIAIAIAMICASIIMLSTVENDKLIKSLGGISMVAVIIAALMASLTKLSFTGTAIAGAGLGIIGISVAILILVQAMKQLGEIDEVTLVKGLASLQFMMKGLSSVAASLAVNTKGMIGAGIALILFASAIKKLVDVVEELGSIDMASLIKGLAALGVMLYGFKLLAADGGLAKMGFSAGAGITMFALGIKILASAVRDLGEIDLWTLSKGVGAVAAMMGTMAIALRAMPKTMPAASLGIVMVAGAIYILAGAVQKFGSIGLGNLAVGIAGVVSSLVTLSTFFNAMNGTKMAASAMSLIVVSVGLYALAGAVGLFGSMPLEVLAKGLISMGVALGIFAVALNAMAGTLVGSASLIVAVTAIGMLVPALILLGSVPFNTLLTGLAGLAGVLLVFAAAGALMGIPMVTTGLMALSITLLSISASIAIASFGLAALALSLAALAAAGWLFVQMAMNVANNAQAFIDGINTIITGIAAAIANGIVTFVTIIATSGGQIVAAVVQLGTDILTGLNALIPQIITTVQTLVSGLLTMLQALLPQIFTVLDQFLTGALALINAHGPTFITTVMTLLNQLLIELQTSVPLFVDLVIATLIAILEGAQRLIPVLVETVIQGIRDILAGLVEITPEIVAAGCQMIMDLVNGIVGLVPQIVEAGMQIIIGFLEGIANKIPDVVEAGVDIIVNFLQGIQDNIGRVTDEAAETVIAFINGTADAINNHSAELRQAGVNLAKAIIDGATGGLASNMGDFVRRVGDMARGAVDSFKNFLGIHSPSRVFYELGNWTIAGAVNAFKDNGHKMGDETGRAGKHMRDTFNKAIEGLHKDALVDLDVQPQIKPIVDMGAINAARAALEDMSKNAPDLGHLTYSQASEIESMRNALAQANEAARGSSVTNVNFVQNNTSPKALDHIDIYRQTNSAVARLKKVAI